MNFLFNTIINKINTYKISLSVFAIIIIIVSQSLLTISFLSKSFSSFVFLSFMIITFLVIYVLLLYIFFEKLYTKLNLNKTLAAFIIMCCNIAILISYILNIVLIFTKIPPIYLKDITVIAQYRYLILVLLSILFGSFFILSRYNNTLKSILIKARFPYMQEEIKIILETRFKHYLEPKCSTLFNALVDPNKRLIYLCIHFFVTCITRIIILSYFINFTFFDGNLVSLRYFLFLSFFLWLLSVALYYFDFFCLCTINYVNSILKVSLRDNLINDPLPFNKSYITGEDLTFEITSEGLQAGFKKPKDIQFLIDVWYKANNVNNSLTIYKKYTCFINMIILCLYFICWCYIIFYHKESLNLVLCG